MRSDVLTLLFILFGTLFNPEVHGQEIDTLNLRIGESNITEKLNTSPLRGNIQRGVAFTQSTIRTYPKSFGESDAISFLQSLPGVSTSAIASPGLYVMGGENSHNQFMIAGAPVFYSARLLGLFPTYHQAHFDRTEFKSMALDHHLGGYLSFEPADTLARRISGSASVGLVSARASLSVPVTDRLSARVSARRSFLNLFYRDRIELYDSPILYDFWDANANVLYAPSDNDKIDVNMLYSHDDGHVEHGSWRFQSYGIWNNMNASARWRHKGVLPQTHTLFLSSYDQFYEFSFDELRLPVPSSILNYGYRGEITIPHFARLSAEASEYAITPQSPLIVNQLGVPGEKEVQNSSLLSLVLDRTFSLGDLSITPSIDYSYYKLRGLDHAFSNFDPQLVMSYDAHRLGQFTLEAARKHQYMSETGMLQSGLPTHFWVSSGVVCDPQEALNSSFSHSLNIFRGAYTISTQAYYKLLYNQLEYTGFFFDLLAKEYSLEDHVSSTDGRNFGASVMVSKNSGKLTGWLSFAYGRAIRTGMISGEMLTFPASHERKFEFNALLDYKAKRFDVSMNMVWASGNPFTPVKHVYLINGNLLAEYHPYNSGRLTSFFRTDVSFDWHLPSKEGTRQGINVSVQNLIGKRFQISYMLDIQDTAFKYGPYLFKESFIPSLSYYYEF